MDPIVAGLVLTGYGLASVFAALIIFYGSIRALTWLFREREQKEEK
ncbi:MAG: OadG family protein [Clostridia bacterium]|nr:OadG family protein [Clostridia bacterium]